MVITELPIETLEHIVAAIDSPADLQNLAVVCTQLRSIIEPYHTQFRVVCAPLTSPLWGKFTENQLLAQNVRILEVQSEDANIDEQVIPTIFPNLEVPSVPDLDTFEDVETLRDYYAMKNAMDLDAERILVSALKGMSGLTSFRWTRTPPLINRNREDDIWITLANHCPSLNVIEVMDCEKPYERLIEESDDPAYQRPSHNPNFYLFKDLKSFSFMTEAFNVGNFLWPDVEQCAKMLVERCPNLEVLELGYFLSANPSTKTVSASPLLSGSPWNSLRELILFGFNFISTELSSYLVSHPTIEILVLRLCQYDESLLLPPHTLPRLKQLSTDDTSSTVTNSVLKSAIAIPRPLDCITGSLLNDVFLDSLEQCGSGPNLDKLIMRYNGGNRDGGSDLGRLITRLSGIAPNLECLYIRVNREISRTLYTVFGQFPHLRTLRGMKFVSSTCRDNTERIRALVALCPNLRRIDWYTVGQLDWNLTVVIERNGSHGTWSLRRIEGERQIEGSVYTLLGERGQGSFEL